MELREASGGLLVGGEGARHGVPLVPVSSHNGISKHQEVEFSNCFLQ